jgi:hypothetical protein
MRALSFLTRRTAIAAGCAAVAGLGLLAATVPAQARAAAPADPRTAGVSPLSCNYNWDLPSAPVKTLARVTTSAGKSWGFGFTGPYDLMQRGIIDPPHVTITALYNYSNCRVWLGQDPTSRSSGWVYCINPRRYNSTPLVSIPEQYRSAERLLVSGNTKPCQAPK